MICNVCKKNEATTHYKSVVNGQVTELWLCPHCANKAGYNNVFSDMATDFSSLLGSFLGNGLPSRTSATRCSKCGSSFADIARSGKVGCAECYKEFYDELLPSIQKMHGNIEHMGKVASLGSPQDKVKSQINKYHSQLAQAVAKQDYETAAKLRDKIKALEEGHINEK